MLRTAYCVKVNCRAILLRVFALLLGEDFSQRVNVVASGCEGADEKLGLETLWIGMGSCSLQLCSLRSLRLAYIGAYSVSYVAYSVVCAGPYF